MHETLLGTWVIDKTDARGVAAFGDVSMSFRDTGELIYTIHAVDRDQIMKLQYRVEGSKLITNQPSVPREEATDFQIGEDGSLTLTFAGAPARFQRPHPPRA